MKLSILIAYPYFNERLRNVLLGRDPSTFRLMVDSGAFSAWHSGDQIKLEEYAKFLRELPPEWEVDAIQLDVIGNPAATKTNFLRMQQMGCDVIPVFTRGAPLEDREWFYEHKDYLCLGGIVKSPEYLAYVRHLMLTNEGRRMHWLGYTTISDIKRYRPFSVDSSNFTMTERWGNLCYYNRGGQIRMLRRKAFVERPPDAFFDACRRTGWKPSELRDLGYKEAWVGGMRPPGTRGKRGFAAYVSVTHHIAHALDTERHIGTRVYIACAHEPQLLAIFHAWDFMQSRGALRYHGIEERV